jgi:hypothetical protein
VQLGVGVGETEGLADGVGVAMSSGPPAANTTAEPIAKVATAATEALTRPRR